MDHTNRNRGSHTDVAQYDHLDFHMKLVKPPFHVFPCRMQTGDPKEQIRKDVQHIVRLICNVMPYTKVYSYLADGMNAKVTKNAKQREGCLKLATWAMESYGLEVCGPKPQDSLKIVAQQVGDRDKDVREAALKNLVEAYQLLGTEKLFKFIGANEVSVCIGKCHKLGKIIVPHSSQPLTSRKCADW